MGMIFYPDLYLLEMIGPPADVGYSPGRAGGLRRVGFIHAPIPSGACVGGQG